MYVKELGCEVKVCDLKFKDVDTKQGIVIGYFSAFGSKDADGDIILPGAYTKSIKERGPQSAKPRIKHLLDHNKTNAVAVIQGLEEDNIGLKYQSKAGRHTAGQDWLKMCEDGIITEHSVGFETVKEQKAKEANYMHELLLWEGSSLQAWGANENTPIESVKGLRLHELSGRIKLLEKAIRNGTYTDETFNKLIKELEAIKTLLDKLSDETTQPGATTDTTEPSEEKEKQIDIINQLFTFKK